MRLVTRSIAVLIFLFGLVFAIGSLLLVHYRQPPWTAVLWALGVTLAQYLLGPILIEWLMPIDWDPGSLIPQANRDFYERFCRERGLRPPPLGYLFSAAPNAFAYGHRAGNARIVVTQGLIETLTPDEIDAVLAHELGHVAHRDFIVMMTAAVAPLILYYIYLWTQRLSHLAPIAWTSYLAYLVGQFAVLMLNRAREFHADQFSAYGTRNPNALSAALLKISYGMGLAAQRAGRRQSAGLEQSKAERGFRIGGTPVPALALLGIAAQSRHAPAPADAAAAMSWDVCNRWSGVYELGSTHPQPARRIQALNVYAGELGQSPLYPLPLRGPVPSAARFAAEFVAWGLPWLLFLAMPLGELGAKLLRLHTPLAHAGALGVWLTACGLSLLPRILMRYPRGFRATNIAALTNDVEASEMRPRPVCLRGTASEAGLSRYSSALRLQDATGQITLVCSPAIPLARQLWWRLRAPIYAGSEVEVRGWYRHGAAARVELAGIRAEGLPRTRIYPALARYAWALLLLALGLFLLSGHLSFT